MIKLVNVSKYYATDKSVSLGLRKINLEFKRKEFIAITGESGSGKSTLLNVISGIDTYDEGEMYFNGEETSYYDESQWIEYRLNKVSNVFQNYNLIDSYSVLENVEVALIIKGLNKNERKKEALRIIKLVGLDKHIKQKAIKLSGGQKQRLAIARALAKDTDIIVCDEPTGNLDSQTGKEIIELLYKISHDKLVIIVTHNFEEVKDYVTRKIRIFDGEVVEDKIFRTVEEDNVKPKEVDKTKKDIFKALNFSLYNFKNQPKKTILLFFTCFLSLIACFIFYANYNIGGDSDYEYSYNYYPPYNERIIAKKKDNSEINANDIKELERINHVDFVCEFDDCIGYQLSGNIKYGNNNEFNVSSLYYVKDCRILEDIDIIGTIPTKENEVVLDFYISDSKTLEKILKDTLIGKQFYFSNSYYMGSLSYEYKIVGLRLLDEDTDYPTIYLNNDGLKYLESTIVSVDPNVQIGFVHQSELVLYNISNFTYKLDNTLPMNTIRICEYSILYTDLGLDTFNSIQIDGKNVDVIIEYGKKDENALYISSDIYESIKVKQIDQVTIDIDNIQSSDIVISKLNALGYYAFAPSTIKSESFSFDAIKSIFETIGLVLKLLFVLIIDYFIIKVIMLSRKKDYAIFKTIGCNNKTIKEMVLFEVSISYIFTYILLLAVFIILKGLKIQYIVDLAYKMTISRLFGLLLVVVLISLFITSRYNKYLDKKSIISTIRD